MNMPSKSEHKGFPLWTYMRDGPFVLGGNHKWRPTYTVVERAAGPFECDHGITLYVVNVPTLPAGRTVVIDGASHGIVSNSLEQAREDIRTGDPEVMRKQMEEAAELFKVAEYKSPDKFWEQYGIR